MRLIPIGVVKVRYSDEEVKDSWIRGGVDGVIEVFPEFEAGLEGIDGFSHLILIAWLHKVNDEQRKVLKVRHRRLLRFGIPYEDLPEVGVFCTDSPHRPNPIALTIVKLVKREGRFLYVEGLDLFDGTPILDIKAYTPDRAVHDLKVPEWYVRLGEKVKKYLGVEVAP
ncbi:MAG TPA: tRNA (N6-threonylcarbamoyladenosine(37)-N6)-methyltransferase TrmO [Acidilobales archaeon]|nr:MAG: tRNA (N6-threonylcarbamoyladenosine(37)-N6)-methyltransferase TrmO [Thermoprotei archaeon]HDD26864.1 tRNA (N6-threonylcarbamoyladenosine(37)-N6)-methyltransferase TrmO [Acidilobales archaeon]